MQLVASFIYIVWFLSLSISNCISIINAVKFWERYLPFLVRLLVIPPLLEQTTDMSELHCKWKAVRVYFWAIQSLPPAKMYVSNKWNIYFPYCHNRIYLTSTVAKFWLIRVSMRKVLSLQWVILYSHIKFWIMYLYHGSIKDWYKFTKLGMQCFKKTEVLPRPFVLLSALSWVLVLL